MSTNDGTANRMQHTKKDVHNGLILHECGYRVCTITEPDKIIEAYRLRYNVFTDGLGWVKRTECGLEIDCYDDGAVFFGVYDGTGSLIAYLRLLLPQGRFMLEDVFSSLLTPGYIIRKEKDTSEVSRLCIAPDARNTVISLSFGELGIMLLLVKGLYRWCVANGIRFVYAVTEEKLCRLYRSRGLPLMNLGKPRRMPDGVLSRAVLLDWREFEQINASSRPRIMEWYRS